MFQCFLSLYLYRCLSGGQTIFMTARKSKEDAIWQGMLVSPLHPSLCLIASLPKVQCNKEQPRRLNPPTGVIGKGWT